MESLHGQSQWSEHEHIDAQDENQRWYNAEILRVDHAKRLIKVQYTGMKGIYYAFFPFESPRIQKQWRTGMQFALNNRLDIYDVKDQLWREAIIVELRFGKQNQGSLAALLQAIKIHYKGYSSNSDEWIDCARELARIKEIGSFSGAEGHAKYSMRMQQELREKEEVIKQQLKKFQPQRSVDSRSNGAKMIPREQEFDYQQIDWQKEEEKFARELGTKNLRIHSTGTDGNCLFRAIAHQAYGDEELHRMIRQKCMDYILNEKDYFKDFIIGGDHSSVEAYVIRKRQNGIWGDDLELQALSELYNRPIEIYAYSKEPMKTFHELVGSEEEPFRLSYHGASHYNSIIPKNWNYEKVFIKTEPGVYEDKAIQESKNRLQALEESVEDESQLEALIQQEQRERVQNIRNMAQMIQRSREDFQISCQRDMEEALRRSMAESYGRAGSTALYRQIENENIQKAIAASSNQMTEEEMIKQAMEESMKEHDKRSANALSGIDVDDALMKTLMAMSSIEQVNTKELTPGVRLVLENGFSLEQAAEAQSVVGDDPEMMLSYLFDKVSLM